MLATATLASSSLRRGLLSCISGRRWRAATAPTLSQQLGLFQKREQPLDHRLIRQPFGHLFSSSLFSSQVLSGPASKMAPVINPGQDVSAAVAQWMAENDVMVFSKTTCPFCIKLKQAFKQARIDFTAVELDTMGATGPEIQNELKAKTGQSTVPNVFIRGKHIGKLSFFFLKFLKHTIRKVKFLSKNSILTKPQHFHEFFTQFFLTIFLVKSKLSTAKNSKTRTFSRVFHPKKSTIFSGNQS